MGSLGDGVKKVLLAGIGTAAVTAEKSKEVLDKMAERGEAAVEQGKVLNQELRHNIKKTVKENVWFALGVKAIVLILAALGYANMWLAVFADVGVALLAILNATKVMRK